VSGGGDNFQGLISVAGSALLSRIQGLLGDALNVSELRLFSATPPSAQNTGELDIGGEIGVNITPNISVSVQKVFTDITPAVFNVRYRINDNLTLRGITSYEQFNENTGAILEIQL
jgi:translocation and assembly module TamB